MNPLNHVAIIMDGNGRWGLKYRNSRNAEISRKLKFHTISINNDQPVYKKKQEIGDIQKSKIHSIKCDLQENNRQELTSATKITTSNH